MNNNSALDPQNEISALARVDFRETRPNGRCEDAPCCGCCGPQGDGDYYGYAAQEAAIEPDDQRGWPGDGSGEDDLADANANAADDYRDEGQEDFGWAGDENLCGE